MNGPIYKVGNVLQLHHNKVKNKYIQEFLVVKAGYPLEEATWELENNFFARIALHEGLEIGQIAEDK